MVVLLLVVILGWAGIVIAAIAAVAAVAFTWRDLLASVRWRPAVLEVPAVPLALGSDPRVIYRREPRKISDIANCTVHCTVVCEERVTYRQGTDTKTDSSKVFEQTFTGEGSGTPRGLEATIPIQIPAHAGAPSFDLGDNEVSWYLDAVITGPGLPDDSERFRLPVGPALDPMLRNQLGDR